LIPHLPSVSPPCLFLPLLSPCDTSTMITIVILLIWEGLCMAKDCKSQRPLRNTNWVHWPTELGKSLTMGSHGCLRSLGSRNRLCFGCCQETGITMIGHLNSYLEGEKNGVRLKLVLVKKQQSLISWYGGYLLLFGTWMVSLFCLCSNVPMKEYCFCLCHGHIGLCLMATDVPWNCLRLI
jgi:hypothetical protein